ncbi:MAG: hypothetical protein QXZ51_03275 [Candidatus Bathyarchaeia archaeon]
MQKILLTLMAIILLTITGLTATNQNQKRLPLDRNDAISNAVEESSGKIKENTQSTQTNTKPSSGCQTLDLDAEANQNPAEECIPQKGDIQTLENSAQNQNSNDGNSTPPDGRIYYPTSSEEPYAYTPTYAPKGTNMPIIPTIPQD